MILVYEYASRGSLDKHLKDKNLTWTQRLKICLDAAKGLCYLHDPRETYQRLIHCDIKSANILLDDNFNAKVADFGLSKIGPANQQNSILVTGASGTPGYLDPVYLETCTLTKESDVYSFGVVLFEVLCGKLCYEYSKHQIKDHVRKWKASYERKQLSGIVFQGLTQQMDPDSLETFADIAYKCLNSSRKERPVMSLVVEKLEESLALQELHDLELPKEHVEIVKAAVPPLKYRSLDELNVLLTKGFHVNEGKTDDRKNKIGSGGFGTVYKGVLSHSEGKSLVAIKRLDRKHDQGDADFYKELRMLSYYRHENIISLLGFSCGPNEMILVYEYASRGSLDNHLKDKDLTWTQRLKICLDAAKGLCYLHDPRETYQRLIHCPANQQNSILVTGASGTPGYLDPVYWETCTLTKESDVYSFGVVLFEVLCGKLCFENSNGKFKKLLPKWKERFEQKQLSEIVIQAMSLVVEKLEEPLALQELHDLKLPKEHVEIVKAAVPPLKYRSLDELNVLLTKGFHVNEGKTRWSCVNRKKTIERIYIEACLNPFHIKATDYYDRPIDNSRFPGGRCYKYYLNGFEASVRDLQFEFEKRATPLLVAGIEFQPSEEKVKLQVFEEYQHIVKDASQSLFYTSLEELKQILSKGLHLNGYKEWFSLNEKGQHCHMISIKDCLIPNEGSTPQYESHCLSRFPAGIYQTNNKGFKTHVKTQLFSPSIAYTINLVYKSRFNAKQLYVDLKYRLREETTFTVGIANRVDEDQFHIYDRIYMAELYQFTSDGSNVDLEIIFENSGTNLDGVEGILFQPLEIVEDQVSKDDKVENIQTISESDTDTYQERNIPNDYEELLKLSNDCEMQKILRRGFVIDNGQRWFSVDKHWKICLMLSARATWVKDDNNSAFLSRHETSFATLRAA
nr:protein kinase-like domain, phloem protein 2-like protein [Tanacetum cinerariifolium]